MITVILRVLAILLGISSFVGIVVFGLWPALVIAVMVIAIYDIIWGESSKGDPY